ncbi:hypothetical protein KY285_023302 [Solanum tuberosum]|nr:hypothetical protein KY289_023638 [Solanum tuberosum]KAH0675501.1 hypothetical protein KY285_023302 [Solanum tuberosum]
MKRKFENIPNPEEAGRDGFADPIAPRQEVVPAGDRGMEEIDGELAPHNDEEAGPRQEVVPAGNRGMESIDGELAPHDDEEAGPRQEVVPAGDRGMEEIDSELAPHDDEEARPRQEVVPAGNRGMEGIDSELAPHENEDFNLDDFDIEVDIGEMELVFRQTLAAGDRATEGFNQEFSPTINLDAFNSQSGNDRCDLTFPQTFLRNEALDEEASIRGPEFVNPDHQRHDEHVDDALDNPLSGVVSEVHCDNEADHIVMQNQEVQADAGVGNPHYEEQEENVQQHIGGEENFPRCGACTFSNTKCSADCIFRPYFPSNTALDFGIIANSSGRTNLKRRLTPVVPELRRNFLDLRRREGLIVANDDFGGCAAALDEKERQIEQLKIMHAKEISEKDDLIRIQAKGMKNLTSVLKSYHQAIQTQEKVPSHSSPNADDRT